MMIMYQRMGRGQFLNSTTPITLQCWPYGFTVSAKIKEPHAWDRRQAKATHGVAFNLIGLHEISKSLHSQALTERSLFEVICH